MRLAIELMEDHDDCTIEDLIDALTFIVERDRAGYIESCFGAVDHNVMECIDATIYHLRNAAVSHYASTK
jgi:hypothetical protein